MRKSTRYSALSEKHRNLEDVIADEMRRPLPDQVELQHLKRQKLALREEMVEWEKLVHILNRQKDLLPPEGRRRSRKRQVPSLAA